jgi:hypothetical protein
MLNTVVFNFTIFYTRLLCLTNFVGIRVIFEGIVNNVLTNVILRRVYLTQFCSRKVVSVTYSECVSFALFIQCAMRMRHIVIYVLPGSTTVLYITSYTAQYSGGKKMYRT